MNRRRQRLAELSRNEAIIPLSPATLPNVQNVQNVQNQPSALAFEHFERIKHRTETALSRPPPEEVSPERWERAREGAKRFADKWAEKAMRLGWRFDELFAIVEPFARADRQGAAWFIYDSTVIAVGETAIALRTRDGATQRVHRTISR